VRDSLFKKLEVFVPDASGTEWRLWCLLVAHVAMLGAALRVEVKTVFDDLLPRNHPYIQVHERIKQPRRLQPCQHHARVDRGDISAGCIGEDSEGYQDLQQVDVSISSKSFHSLQRS